MPPVDHLEHVVSNYRLRTKWYKLQMQQDLDLQGYNVKVTVCRSAGKKCRCTFQDRDYIMLSNCF